MPTVVVEMVMETGLHMVTTMLVHHIWVDHNHQEIVRTITHIDISLMLLGVLVVMVHVMVTEVPEDVKVWS